MIFCFPSCHGNKKSTLGCSVDSIVVFIYVKHYLIKSMNQFKAISFLNVLARFVLLWEGIYPFMAFFYTMVWSCELESGIPYNVQILM